MKLKVFRFARRGVERCDLSQPWPCCKAWQSAAEAAAAAAAPDPHLGRADTLLLLLPAKKTMMTPDC